MRHDSFIGDMTQSMQRQCDMTQFIRDTRCVHSHVTPYNPTLPAHPRYRSHTVAAGHSAGSCKQAKSSTAPANTAAGGRRKSTHISTRITIRVTTSAIFCKTRAIFCTGCRTTTRTIDSRRDSRRSGRARVACFCAGEGWLRISDTHAHTQASECARARTCMHKHVARQKETFEIDKCRCRCIHSHMYTHTYVYVYICVRVHV